MVLVNFNGPMEEFMKDNGKTVFNMELEKLGIGREFGDKENGKMEKKLIHDIFTFTILYLSIYHSLAKYSFPSFKAN